MKETISRAGFESIQDEITKLNNLAKSTSQAESIVTIKEELDKQKELKNNHINEAHGEALLINDLYNLDESYPFSDSIVSSEDYVFNLYDNAIESLKTAENVGAGYDEVISQRAEEALKLLEQDNLNEEDRSRFINILKELKKDTTKLKKPEKYGLIEDKKFTYRVKIDKENFNYTKASAKTGESSFFFRTELQTSPTSKHDIEVDIKRDIRDALDLSRLTEKTRNLIMATAPESVIIKLREKSDRQIKYEDRFGILRSKQRSSRQKYYVDKDDILSWSRLVTETINKNKKINWEPKEEVATETRVKTGEINPDNKKTLLELIKDLDIRLVDLVGNIYNLGEKTSHSPRGPRIPTKELELVFDQERILFLMGLMPKGGEVYNIHSFFQTKLKTTTPPENKSYLAFKMRRADGKNLIVISTDVTDNADFVFDGDLRNGEDQEVWRQTAQYKKDEIRIKEMPSYIGRQIHAGKWKENFVKRFLNS